MSRTIKENIAREWMAAHVVAAQIGCQFTPLDMPNAGNGLPDFLLRSGTERIGVLEVTLHTDASYHSFYAELDKRFGGPEWTNAPVKSYWHIGFHGHEMDVKGLEANLPPLLRLMEQRGFGRLADRWRITDWQMQRNLHRARPDGFPSPSEDQLLHVAIADLGIDSAWAWPNGKSNTIFLSAGMSGVVGPTLANAAVDAEVGKADNLRKLRSHDGEQHLWIWLDGAKPFTIGVVEDGEVPDPPDLPEGITTVWLGSPSGALWRLSPDEGWSVVSSARRLRENSLATRQSSRLFEKTSTHG